MSIINKVKNFASSPQGKKAMADAQRMVKDPATRRKLQGLTKRGKRTH